MDWLVQKLDHAQDKYYEIEYHDRVVRSIVNFKTPLVLYKLENSIKKLIDIVPVLNSVLVDHGHTITWHSRDTYDKIISFERTQKMFLSKFLVPIDETKDPQIRITIWQTSIGIAVNNMVLDVYSLRDLVCLFIDLYKNIDNHSYVSKYTKIHSRNIYKFFKTVKFSKKYLSGSLKVLSKEGHNKFTLPIPPQDQTVTNRFFMTETISALEVGYLKEYAKKNGTTLEDIMLGAYHKALAVTMGVENQNFCIGRFFNARNSSKIKPYISWNNLHAVIPYSFKTVTEQDFIETVKEVDKISDFIRDHNLVIKTCMRDTKKQSYHDDYFLFAYVRVLDDITVNGVQPEIMFTMAARNVPYAGFTFTESADVVRISAVNYIDGNGQQILDYILQMIHYYIQVLIYQINNGIAVDFAPQAHQVLDLDTLSDDINVSVAPPAVKKGFYKASKQEKAVAKEQKQLAKEQETPEVIPQVQTSIPTPVVEKKESKPTFFQRWKAQFKINKKPSVAKPVKAPKVSKPVENKETKPTFFQKWKAQFKINKKPTVKHEDIKVAPTPTPVVEQIVSTPVVKTNVVKTPEPKPTPKASKPVKAKKVVKTVKVKPAKKSKPVAKKSTPKKVAKVVKAKPAPKKVVHAKKPVVKKSKPVVAKVVKAKPIKKAPAPKPVVKKAKPTTKPVVQTNTAQVAWTPAQHQLVVAFKQYHGEQLVPVEGDPTKVKYLIKGKNTYQKRSWAEIQKFVDFKTGVKK